MAFYSEKDQKCIGAALTALRSMEDRPASLDDVIDILDFEKNRDCAGSHDNCKFLDDTAVYLRLSNLTGDVINIQREINAISERFEEVPDIAGNSYDTASRAHADVSFPENEPEPEPDNIVNDIQRQIDALRSDLDVAKCKDELHYGFIEELFDRLDGLGDRKWWKFW